MSFKSYKVWRHNYSEVLLDVRLVSPLVQSLGVYSVNSIAADGVVPSLVRYLCFLTIQTTTLLIQKFTP